MACKMIYLLIHLSINNSFKAMTSTVDETHNFTMFLLWGDVVNHRTTVSPIY